MPKQDSRPVLATTIGVRGEYELYARKIDEEGNEISRRFLHAQENLITDTGMNALGTMTDFRTGFGVWCRVGSGSTPPAYTQVALAAQVAAVGRGVSNPTDLLPAWGAGADSKKYILTLNFTFATGAAAGNLTELGLGNSASDNLHTRSLFTDGGGSPITVTVLSDEQLIVIYRIIFTCAETDAVFGTTTSPTPVAYTLTLRPSGLGVDALIGASAKFGVLGGINNHTEYHGVSSGIGATTASPTGTAASVTAPATFGTYTAGTFQRDDSCIVSSSTGNNTNIGAFKFFGWPFNWQVGISPRFTKINPETVKFTIRTSWTRA